MLDNEVNDINIIGDEVKVVMLPPDKSDDQDSAGDLDNSNSLDGDVGKLSIKLLEEIQNKEAVSKFSSPLSGKNLPFSSLSDKLEKKNKEQLIWQQLNQI